MNQSRVQPTASSVSFSTEARLHIAIGVRDLEASVPFYALLFEQEPTKQRPRYAKFEVERSPVNFALNEIEAPTQRDTVSHFGIQVKHQDEISAAIERFSDAGYKVDIEESVSCCYAVQNKAWVTDPDGNMWEIFMVLADTDQYAPDSAGDCCTTTDGAPCCDEEEKAQGCCS